MIDRLADPSSSGRRLLIIATVWISVLIIGAVGILSTFHPKIGLLQPPTNPAVSATPGQPSPTPGPNPVAGPVGPGGGSSAGKGTLTGTGYPPGDVEDEPKGSSCLCSQVPKPGSVVPLPVPTHVLPSISPLPKVP